MSTKNNKSIASQALLEMDTIVSAIKEESKKSLNTLLDEAVRSALREECEEEDEKEYEVEDEEDGTNDKDEKDSEKSSSDVSEDENDELEDGSEGVPATAGQGAMQQGAEAQPADGEAQEAPAQGQEGLDNGEGGNEWDEFSKYQVGDNTYDLTGENDYDSVVKVYKLLQDDDQVVVKKDGNKVDLKDNEAGTEYVIDFGTDDADADVDAQDNYSEEGMDSDSLNEENDIAGFPDDEDSEFNPDSEGWDEREDEFDLGEKPWDYSKEDGEFDFDDESLDDEPLDDEPEEDEPIVNTEDDVLDLDSEDENNFQFESKNSRKPMKENKEVLFEVDLGYTDNYQDKDPIAGLSNDEPSKSGKSWHKGVPTGTKKPWAGPTKDKGKPFGEKTIEEEDDCCKVCGGKKGECDCEKEVDEQTNVGGFVQQNSVTTSHTSNSSGRKARSRRGSEFTPSTEPRYANESKELRRVKKENKELKEAVVALRKNLNESYVTNVNIGKILKLFLENTTTKAEKFDIVNRFSEEAKTVEQANTLYESISRELKKSSKAINLNETSVSANGTKELNESKQYAMEGVSKTIEFMNRMQNI